MSYNRRSGGGYGGNSGNYGGGGGYSQSGNSSYGGSNNYGGGNNYNGSSAGRYNNYNNYGRNPKMSPWESGVSPGGGNMMPNVHPNQMALASDLLSKIFANDHQGGYGGNQNWGPSPGMMRRQESFKNQNRRRPDNRNRRPPPKKDDKKKDPKLEADKNDQSRENADGIKKETTGQEHVDYDGIPTAVLFCHVCQKHMWDGASFEKHVRGRPHELMMTYLDETYKMQVELMRHQIRAAENQREIDLERMQAQNKGKAKPLFQNYCPMCNINFYGPLTGHRKSDRHRKLKQFLHPECKMCDTLFHTRLEWDDHKLSANHLRKVGEQRRLHNPDLKDDEFELLDVVQINDVEQTEEIPVGKKTDMIEDKDIKEEVEEEDIESNEKNKSSENNDTELDGENGKEKEVTNEEQNENAKENDSELKKDKDEKYNPANVVGRELVVKTGGFVCRICSVFMKDNEEANLHCQTATHYINFTTITKLHAKINNRKRKVKEDKKETENGDINAETNDEPTAKQARLEENGENSFTEQNGTKEADDDDDVQEIKQDVPVVEIMDDDKKSEIEETAPAAEIETPIEAEPVVEPEVNPVKEEAEPIPPPAKTTPTRGRGGARGRGVARRGRSSR